jgi:predicted transcriptional regulator
VPQIRARAIAFAKGPHEPKPGNLSRTLKTMSRYGLVELQRESKHLRPIVKASGFRILAAA